MWPRACLFFEIAALSVLVLTSRCANYRDVFVGGDIYFTDADCYARMTRARICFEHPGSVVRHHEFENFPVGTSPHTTAPLDYAIAGLGCLLRPFSAQPLDLAGALISPLLATGGAWFLCWWLRKMRFAFRVAALGLFAASPILVHATELGRPDHQSLALMLGMVALCAEWSLEIEWSRAWSTTSALAWAVALWVSIYEPLVIFALVVICKAIIRPREFFARRRRSWWLFVAAVILTAGIVERRALPLTWPPDRAAFTHWLDTIGELRPVRLDSRSWVEWCGYFLPLAPVLGFIAFRRRMLPPWFVIGVSVVTFGLTVWQARWAYFFVAIFSLVLPVLLMALPAPRAIVFAMLCVSMFPLLQAWDATLWPNESIAAERTERRREMVELRAAVKQLPPAADTSFLAPWWLSPAIAYWAREPGVAGSSHQSIDGIVDTARFFLSTDPDAVRAVLRKHHVAWVLSYDADRTVANSAGILGRTDLGEAASFGRVLDRTPSRAPPFLVPTFANATTKLFRVDLSREKGGFPEASR
ncbi:MAG: hypothetical protein M3Z64_03855 [Verrucomicrobiota bacterium]|nr:hypothetical protein [Verrucomicrobiota bacterium]